MHWNLENFILLQPFYCKYLALYWKRTMDSEQDIEDTVNNNTSTYVCACVCVCVCVHVRYLLWL